MTPSPPMPSQDATLRDLANVRAAAALADTASFADIEKRLKPFDAEGNPWRHVAREIMAAVQWRLKDYAGRGPPGAGHPRRSRNARHASGSAPPMMAQLLQPLVAKQ